MIPDCERIVLRDTTLREGVQIPGSHIEPEHKQQFVRLLDELGIPEIEIGLPDGLAACAGLSHFIHQSGFRIQPSSLLPSYFAHWREQVDAAVGCGLRLDVLAPLSDQLLRETSHYKMTPEEILPRLGEVIAYARGRGVPAGAALIDACRAPRERLLETAAGMASLGAERIVIYDSVGTMLPWHMSELIGALKQVTSLPILVHCHNDHGLAVANTLAALTAGASAADVSVNGLGGRAGNAAIEEVVMALERLCGRPTGVDTSGLRRLSAFAETMTGLKNWPLKPIVGRYSFAHVPVMHIRCIAGGNPEAFEPFDPRLVGAKRTYGFCLPVDYSTALEPFMAKCSGQQQSKTQIHALVEQLRNEPDKTEEQVLQSIRDFLSREISDGTGPDRVQD